MPRTVTDYRLGGEPIWRIVPDDWEGLMRLPDEVLKSVVFLGHKELDPKTHHEIKVLKGTGFFVALPIGLDANLICLVTARHVARQIEHGEFFIRANTKSGKAQDIPLDGGLTAKWIVHETDETVDAAALLWCPSDDIEFRGIPIQMFLDQDKLRQKRIGIGDEVFATGLFSFHRGERRNEPIVRHGHIAMMPTERIPVRRWHPDGIEGYLIEGRSIGGFSGSPVFVRRSIQVQAIEESGQKPLAAGATFWLGLMHGHWDAEAEDIDVVRSVGQKPDPEEAINAGIAIVVPCSKILELLNHPTIREAARHAVEVLESKHAALLDGGSPNSVKHGKENEASRVATLAASSAPMTEYKFFRDAKSDSSSLRERSTVAERKGSTEQDEPNPDHKEDFTRLLNAAAKTRKSDD